MLKQKYFYTYHYCTQLAEVTYTDKQTVQTLDRRLCLFSLLSLTRLLVSLFAVDICNSYINYYYEIPKVVLWSLHQ